MWPASPWIDVTLPIRTGMVHWPGDPPVEVAREEHDGARIARLSLGSHTGTHMDAPAHYLRDGATLDAMPLDTFVGPARVVAVEGPAVREPDIAAVAPQRGERLIFKTRNSARPKSDDFDRSYVGLDLGAARALAAAGVRCVCIDYLSIAGFDEDGPAVHRALLGAGVWILEGLDLAAIEPGDWDLVCLPLRIAAGDGAPARAMLRRAA
jgi:arylformamidase